MVVAEKATDALTSADRTIDALPWRTIDELVAQPLVVSFTVVMGDELAERTTEVPLSERNATVEALAMVKMAAARANHELMIARHTGLRWGWP